MGRNEKERRKYNRYDMEVKVNFYVNYALETKVEFQIIEDIKDIARKEKRTGISRNFSSEGMRFSSDEKLKKGDGLFIEVYLPKQQQSIPMTGMVQWSRQAPSGSGERYKFNTGVRLITVKGKSVAETIYNDEKYGISWSIVLESVFGNFKKFIQSQK